MSTQYVERTIALIRHIKGQELLPHAVRLLSNGEPVTFERLAAAAEWPLEDVGAALGKHINAERDEDGRLVGFGLTLRPTPIRFTVGNRTMFAWCADDALMFPVILGRPGVVESACPQTRQSIRIELAPDSVERVDPPDAVVSAIRPADPGQVADIRSECCQRGLFFSSTTAATPWADAHREGVLHPVEEAFRQDREIIKRLGWDARRDQAC